MENHTQSLAFVIGGEHANYEKNLAFANELQKRFDSNLIRG